MKKYLKKWRHKWRVQRQEEIKAVVSSLLPLTNSQGQPNINELWSLVNDTTAIRLNIKNFGYELGRRLAPALADIPSASEPARRNLVSKPTTQADIESPWFVYWCKELRTAPIYHRKLWEFAFMLQALYDADLIRPGVKGVGFGCGEEPLASYLASKEMDVLVTDLAPDKAAGLGWRETGQHASTLKNAFDPELVSAEKLHRHVKHAYVDMNEIPDFGEPFDFCWSICALEHLGSIEKGLSFIKNSLRCLKPGGTAIHTTEFNYFSSTQTIDHWPTVLFQRQHFEQLASALAAEGHVMLGPDFDVGQGPVDRFIDVPPYSVGAGWLSKETWRSVNQPAHLKLSVDGFPCTCYGIIVRKRNS